MRRGMAERKVYDIHEDYSSGSDGGSEKSPSEKFENMRYKFFSRKIISAKSVNGSVRSIGKSTIRSVSKPVVKSDKVDKAIGGAADKTDNKVVEFGQKIIKVDKSTARSRKYKTAMIEKSQIYHERTYIRTGQVYDTKKMPNINTFVAIVNPVKKTMFLKISKSGNILLSGGNRKSIETPAAAAKRILANEVGIQIHQNMFLDITDVCVRESYATYHLWLCENFKSEYAEPAEFFKSKISHFIEVAIADVAADKNFGGVQVHCSCIYLADRIITKCI